MIDRFYNDFIDLKSTLKIIHIYRHKHGIVIHSKEIEGKGKRSSHSNAVSYGDITYEL